MDCRCSFSARPSTEAFRHVGGVYHLETIDPHGESSQTGVWIQNYPRFVEDAAAFYIPGQIARGFFWHCIQVRLY